MTYFCSVCERAVRDSCRSIFCDCCLQWVHQNKCSGVNIPQFEILSLNSKSWFCPKCINTSLPFSTDGNLEEPEKIPRQLNENLKSIIYDLNKVSNADKNLEPTFDTTNCKYYECHDFNNTMSQYNRNTSALHLNISSLAKHFDELNTLLSLLQLNFSFIGISETRFLNGREPVLDYSISGYSHFSTPTESTAGGVILYISNTLAFKPRLDLSSTLYSSKLLESVFVEIINPNKPNSIVGVIYRHPCMSLKSFNLDFLTPFLHKVSLENKELILLGDFNVNLLSTDEDSSHFLDCLGSNLVMPQILLPTRIAGDSHTLIDNIFSSVTGSSNISGNICYKISDHLPRFCIFSTEKNSNAGESVKFN